MILLDTHALLWWLAGDDHMPASTRLAIQQARVVHVSAVSTWEIAIKTQQGKLPNGEVLLAQLPALYDAQGFVELVITGRDAHMAGLLPRHHRDPFDRMLVAQALRHGLPLVSNDPLIAKYGVPMLW